jgi:diguanylate cyclase (GGDEF)-like protein/PAS domain S-box-containing protein
MTTASFKLRDVKIWVRLVFVILLAVMVSGVGLIHWSTLEQKNIAADQAKEFANSVHQMTLAGLTGMMITGTVSLRALFLDQIKEMNHVDSLQVYRGDAVVKQYGAGYAGEIPSDPVVIQVLQSGEPFYAVVRGKNDQEQLKAVIPAVALENYLGKNCTFCHDVKPGTVLGAVSMEISLARANETTRRFGLNAVMAGLALCIPLALIIWYFISRLVTRPLQEMTDGLNQVASGDIEEVRELRVWGKDEVGMATQSFNRVMDKAYELIQEQRLSRIVFDNSLESITITDAHSNIRMVNHAFTHTTGYTADEVIGKTPAILKSGKQGPEFYKSFWESLKEHGEWRGEIWNKRKNGSIYPEWLNISVVKNRHDEVEYYVAIFTDITERKAYEERITFQAFHDALTGLPNRILFHDRLDQALTQAKRRKLLTPAVMFLDLDRFKLINDTLGHDAGDVLLKEVANRLRACVRESDTVARFGGDEFTVLLPEITQESDARAVAMKILDAMQEPVLLVGKPTVITTSIGISLYARDGSDAETLMKHADAAMYHVKGSGRADMRFFSEDLFGKPSRRSELELRLSHALANNEFVLHYQPLVDLQNGMIYGNEALLRWHDPEDGLREPEEFLSLAEDSGLMLPVGEWILETACVQARSWQAEGRPMIVAINLSAHEFNRPDLLELVRQVLKMAGLSPQLLELEIGETLAMQDIEYSAKVFQGLRELGVRVAIDDFGTGFSSLAALNRLPITSLKIDGSFVRSCVEDPSSRAIVSAIIGTANALGFSIVAEGVETNEQLEVLRNLVCDRAQGHLFSSPLPGSDLRQMMASPTPWSQS